MAKRLDQLDEKWNRYQSERNQVINQAITDFNTAYKEKDLPVLLLPEK